MLDLVVHDEPPHPRPRGLRAVNVWRDDQGVPFAEAFRQDGGHRLEWRGIGTIVFDGSSRVAFWPAPGLPMADALDRVERVAQPVVLQALGYETLHASAARLASGIVAFCGLSGSGKSTLAYALGQRPGIEQVADDAVVIEIDADEITAAPLPFRSRLRKASQTFFHREEALAIDPPAAARAPLAAVVLLDARPDLARPVDVERIASRSAFAALLTHAHCFDEHDRTATSRMIQHYLDIAARVPVFRLAYVPDFSHLDALVEAVVRTVGEAAAARR